MLAAVVILGLLAPGSVLAQNPDSQQQLPMPVPPPLPPKPPPKDAPMYRAIVPDSDKPWVGRRCRSGFRISGSICR